MQKLFLLSVILVCLFSLVGCSAPDDSENGPVRIFNISKSPLPNETAQTDVVHRVKTRGVGGYLTRVFNDKNDIQLVAAQSLGINPIYSLKDAYNVNRSLRKIESCDDFLVDSLTHSMPYICLSSFVWKRTF